MIANNLYEKILAMLGLLLPLLLWMLVVHLFHPPRYLLPSPSDVLQVIVSERAMLWHHASITFFEAIIAWIFALVLGMGSASLMVFFKTLRFTLMPLLLTSQAIPIFAIAPLVVVWLGFGIASKVMVALLVLYFPITLSFYEGLCATPQKWLDLATVAHSSNWRTFVRLRFPFALGRLGSGVKMAAVWAPMGAVIGEWVGASEGLGFLMLEAHARLETQVVFAALFTLLLFSLVFYTLVNQSFRRLVFWERFL